ncbi:helix-turn-helix domain-containing protein [Streptomyces microflavus]|uniref:helix-turn-helix domain-containing protein n=1 Tax=Streptomyces microflavus TaxID=1919 RepID=UPI0036CDCE89
MGAWDDLGMPRSSNDQVPRHYVVGGAWPHAALAPGAPVSAHYGQGLARNLERAMASTRHTLRTLADVTGVTHSTISRVLNGKVPPDLGTPGDLSA